MQVAASVPGPARVSLGYLDHLSTRSLVDGRELLVTHIYADPPDYHFVGAPGEGIAALDDVARAAVVYLDEHHATGNAHALAQGRAALDFVLHLQQPDGTFTNFVTDEHCTPNLTGRTSRPQMGWWTLRGMWALARGYRELQASDPAYASQLLVAYRASEQALTRTIVATGTGTVPGPAGRAVPAWLRSLPADQAAVGVLALAEMQQAHPNPETGRLLATLASGIAAMRMDAADGTLAARVAHTTSMPQAWHAWGAGEALALARAGRVLGRVDLVDAARGAVEGVLAWQLANGRIQQLTPLPDIAGQQSYGVGQAVQAAAELYRATGERRYAQMAGLAASWYTGNNITGEAIYDAASGRCLDGIDGPGAAGVNRSAGAESTIEALMALQSIRDLPQASRLATLRSGQRQPWAIARAAAAPGARLEKVAAAPDPEAPLLEAARIAAGAHLDIPVSIARDGEYLLAASTRHDAGDSGLELAIDGTPAGRVAGSARDGFALEGVAGAGMHLTAGRHVVTVRATGADALVDGVLLAPAHATMDYLDVDGRGVTATWDQRARRLSLHSTGGK